LPEHGIISLQAAVQHFTPAQRESILRLKVRDLELAQFRLAAPFSTLAAGYRAALADFLGQASRPVAPAIPRQSAASVRSGANVAPTLKKLNSLDARRREAEARLDASPLPKVLNQTGH
jgi:hypothetical protein